MRKQLAPIESVINTEPLHLKYRPKTFKEVIGQDEVVKSIQASLKAKARPHVFLFTGGTGTGKTTLARILTREFQVDQSNIVEVDAATNNGIDVMRDIMSPLRYHGFGDTPNKAIILDEAHMLSKQAWASLLKTIEEPPAHVFFFFCTTDAGKVPDNIVTRCQAYNLRQVKYDPLMDLLEHVASEEGYDVSERILGLIARSSEGSPRRALVMLAMVHDCPNEEEAARVLETPMEHKEIIDLCRELVKGDLTWPRLQKTLKGLGDMPAESIRIVIVNYLNSYILGTTGDKATVRLLGMLECFSKPCPASDKMAGILLAFGYHIFP